VTGSPGVAVLVSSCDAYRDLWPPFFELLFRHWPDCPRPVYLGSESERFDDARVECLATSPRDWSSSLASMLEQVRTDHVLLLLEDYLMYARARTVEIRELARFADQRRAACLRLFPCPGPDVDCVDRAGVGVITPGAPFRVSLQAALWRRADLLALLVPGESPWQFETRATQRSVSLPRVFLSVKRGHQPLSYFCTGVRRGRWLRDGVSLCERQGVAVDLGARSRESWAAFARRRLLFRLRGCRIDACRRQCPAACTRAISW
jgi:hypothetical protein